MLDIGGHTTSTISVFLFLNDWKETSIETWHRFESEFGSISFCIKLLAP